MDERPARESMRPMNVFERERDFFAFLGDVQMDPEDALELRRPRLSLVTPNSWNACSSAKGGVTRSKVGEGGVKMACESSEE